MNDRDLLNARKTSIEHAWDILSGLIEVDSDGVVRNKITTEKLLEEAERVYQYLIKMPGNAQ